MLASAKKREITDDAPSKRQAVHSQMIQRMPTENELMSYKDSMVKLQHMLTSGAFKVTV